MLLDVDEAIMGNRKRVCGTSAMSRLVHRIALSIAGNGGIKPLFTD